MIMFMRTNGSDPHFIGLSCRLKCIKVPSIPSVSICTQLYSEPGDIFMVCVQT